MVLSRRRSSLVGLLGICLAVPFVAGEAHAAEVKLFAGGGGSEIGKAVAIDGDTIVVGSDQDQTAYVFTRTDGVWTQTGELYADDGGPGDRFGWSVAIDGETIVVGAPGADGEFQDQGAVYTFARTGAESRPQTAKLTTTDHEYSDQFGWSVAVDGSTIVATAPYDNVGDNADEGSAYTFASTGGDRTQTAKLTTSDHAPGDLFGMSLVGNSAAIDGDTIVIGQMNASEDGLPGDHGAVYTFSSSGGNRTETNKILAAVPRSRESIGNSVDIDGDTIVAGAAGYDGGDVDLDNSGAVFTFTRGGAQTGELTAPTPEWFDQLGYSVAIEGDVIYAGANSDDVDVALNQDEGSVQVFRRPAGGGWAWNASLRAADEAAYDQLGTAAAVDEGTLAVGVPGDDVGLATDRGSVWTFDDPVPVTLRVTKSGTGKGTVTSTPAGINCGPDCLRSYPRGSGVVLKATPASGSTFAGFSGAGCTVSPCTVSMTQANTVNAKFSSLSDPAACQAAKKKLAKAKKRLKKLKQEGASASAIKKAAKKKKVAQAAVTAAC